MIYVWHHVITLVLAVGVGAGLARARWTHRCPRVAVLLWQATALSALTASIGILLSAGLAPYRLGIVPAFGRFASDLAGGSRPPDLGVSHLIAVAAGVVLSGWAIAVQMGSSWRTRRHRSRHQLLLRLLARPDQEDHAVVLDHPAAAAYYLPGRAGGCVVISSGAQAALTGAQLQAVLAHEHAHARERHHLVIAPFHALRHAIRCPATARFATCVELLVEMCADDRAARRQGPAPLIAALRRFRTLGASSTPPGALAIADHTIEQRIRRLQHPQPPLDALTRGVAVASALVVAATPVSLFILPV